MTSGVPPLLTAALADRYRIERELGAGGMATVYLAHDLKHDRDVAIKVLKPEIGQTVGAERFLREIQLAARLSHPHILPLHDSGEADGMLYYVMPNVEGRSLRDRLDESRQLPVEEALSVTREVAGALDYAHRHGVVHRDIKPENIMLQDGHALVADFGIGKALSDVEGEAFTQTGMSVGTPAYMSPEQAAGEAVDGRSDLYSLGCVLYEMLAGEQPFTGPTVQAVIAKRFVQTPADLTALREGVSRVVARAVQQALARTPIDRFHTGAAFAAAVSQADPLPVVVAAAPAPEKSIAVLPFTSMSSDPENEFFADGITEEILNALAQIAELRVAGRTSSFSFKGKHQDLRQIGEALTVRTVLEGSVRRAGNRVRITAQLIDGQTGHHIWAERYEDVVSDVFDLQERITRQVVGTMVPEIEAQEMRLSDSGQRRYREVDDMAWRAAKAMSDSIFGGTPGRSHQAIEQASQAIALDPSCALAWYVLSNSHAWRVFMAWAQDRATELAVCRHAADTLLDLAPNDSRSYFQRGIAQEMAGESAAGASDLRRALELNPNDATAAFFLSFFEAAEGNIARAKELASRALRMSPKDRWVSTAQLAQALCAFVERDWQALHDWADLAIQAQATHPIRRVLMIAFAAEVGDMALLRKHLGRLQAVSPDFVASLFRGDYRPLHRPEHMTMLLDSLRRAGLEP